MKKEENNKYLAHKNINSPSIFKLHSSLRAVYEEELSIIYKKYDIFIYSQLTDIELYLFYNYVYLGVSQRKISDLLGISRHHIRLLLKKLRRWGRKKFNHFIVYSSLYYGG